MSKTAVILFNLGGPDGPSALRPFLYRFFMDPNIIALPLVLRWPLAMLLSTLRAFGKGRKIYAPLGGKSPLGENTQAQAQALEKRLGPDCRVFVCMRYTVPRSDAVARAVRDWGAEAVVLLPLYPQFSTATTRSSFQDWDRAAARAGLDVPVRKVCCYPLENGFIRAAAEAVRTAYAKALAAAPGPARPLPRVLFSAHGLPESVIGKGDPYQDQCERTAAAIATETGIPELDWTVCYQSRVGPKKWIGPSTEQALATAAADGVPVLVYSHAFVNEHVETLVEIDIEYRALAERLGIPLFIRVPTVGTAPDFIGGLAALVRAPAAPKRLCSSDYKACGHVPCSSAAQIVRPACVSFPSQTDGVRS